MLIAKFNSSTYHSHYIVKKPLKYKKLGGLKWKLGIVYLKMYK